MKILMLLAPLIAAAPVFTIRPLVDEDVLEPSVQNEVDHALSRAPTNLTAAVAAAATKDLFATNGLDATAIAIKLISLQRADGRWYLDETNDVSTVAVEILKHIGGE